MTTSSNAYLVSLFQNLRIFSGYFNIQSLSLFSRFFEITSKNALLLKGKMAIVRVIFDFGGVLTSEGYLLEIALRDS